MKYQIQHKNGQRIVNLNRRRAIRERCLNCSGWELKKVAECEISDCSLYPYRIGTGKQNPKHRSKAIRSYCLRCMNGQRYEVKKCVSPDCALFPYRNVHVDRSTEIKFTTKKHHIQPAPQPKIKKPYLSMDREIQVRNKASLTGAGIGSREKMVLSPWQNHRSNHSRGMNGNRKGTSTAES